MKKRVYLETTIVSYLASRPSRDLVVAAHQEITREWWEKRRKAFAVYISQVVLDESSSGDREAAKRRFDLVASVPVLAVTEDVAELAERLIDDGPIPREAADDALHIAVAAVHGIDFLLTWNCKHLANAQFRGAVSQVLFQNGYASPIICTPEELMETGHA
jgi:predicted nucleic acid-binding protein